MNISMQRAIIGWDIGGAHLKAAIVTKQGLIEQVFLEACPLWQGMSQLEQAVQSILSQLPLSNYLHVITMTGELVDCFDNRDQGVSSIIATMQKLLAGQDLAVYAGMRGFLSPADISPQEYLYIASANWLASASLAARQVGEGLFIDIGSTTTDLLLLNHHQVNTQAYTDYQRLVSGELIYTGIVRTAIMAITQSAEFKGVQLGLMAEYFATMADVYRLTGDLNEAHDHTATADGHEKTSLRSAIRLSRMIAYEFNQQDWNDWLAFAHHLKNLQKQRVLAGITKRLSQTNSISSPKLIGAGIGRFLVKEIATEQGYAYQDFAEMLPQTNGLTIDANDCAPAVAVAYLAGGFC